MRYRTIFLSDIHLGTRGCQAGLLLDFLARHDADTFFLVGDIVDLWRLGRGWVWPQAHSQVVQAILAKARGGARVVLVPGNHDEALRAYPGIHLDGIEVTDRAEHLTPDGRRFLVIHGDQFDAVILHAKWLAHLGERAYDVALWLNIWLDRLRRLTGRKYWSLSNWAKSQVKSAVNHIGDYEAVLTAAARRGGYDGIVCGHIHSASLRRIHGIDYVNTGDWVESCTAVAERADGSMLIIDWAAAKRRRHAIELARSRAAATGRTRRQRKQEAASA